MINDCGKKDTHDECDCEITRRACFDERMSLSNKLGVCVDCEVFDDHKRAMCMKICDKIEEERILFINIKPYSHN